MKYFWVLMLIAAFGFIGCGANLPFAVQQALPDAQSVKMNSVQGAVQCKVTYQTKTGETKEASVMCDIKYGFETGELVYWCDLVQDDMRLFKVQGTGKNTVMVEVGGINVYDLKTPEHPEKTVPEEQKAKPLPKPSE